MNTSDGFSRPSREETYHEICEALRQRSTCRRGKVGALLVRDRRIIATGYNGAPPGAPHCFELGCQVDENNHEAGCQRTVHAESNAVAFAARFGVSTLGATSYCTHGPCIGCAKLLISAGIELVVFETPYRRTDGLELLDAVGIPYRQFGTSI